MSEFNCKYDIELDTVQLAIDAIDTKIDDINVAIEYAEENPRPNDEERIASLKLELDGLCKERSRLSVGVEMECAA